jgi:hypothetical protein
MSDLELELPGPGVHLRDVRPCDSCGKPLAKRMDEPARLNAYRIRLDSLVLDMGAVRQFGGMALFFGGNELLAGVFAPDPELYKCFGRDELLVCFHCYATRSLASIAESARDRREKVAAAAASPDSQADGHREAPDPEVEGPPTR